jgi:hypothetical protein
VSITIDGQVIEITIADKNLVDVADRVNVVNWVFMTTEEDEEGQQDE